MSTPDNVPTDNPAGRLYHLLSEAKRKGPGNKFGDVWAQVLGVDPDDKGRVLKLLAEVILEVHRAKAAIEKYPDINQELFLRPLEEVEHAFKVINFGTKWESWEKRLKDPTLTGLAYCADRLSDVQPEGTISEDELTELRGQLDDLLDHVLEADIDDALKQILVDGIEHLRRAILEYKIRGAEGLREALEQNFGILLLHHQDLTKDEETKKTAEKVFGVLKHVQTTLNIIWVSRQLTPPVFEAVAGLIAGGS